jgi:outer membrane protein OmpA-like peptidoglycan-associated protein/tetratricopeptide (TPR) repeat protein
MTRIKIVLSLLLFLPLFSFSQYTEEQLNQLLEKSSESELVTESSQMIQEGYYYQAGLLTDKLLRINPTSPNYNYRRAFIYMEMSRDFAKAIPLLEIAVQQTDKNWDAFSANEKSAPIDAFYHLGRAYHMDLQLDKATANFNKFLELTNPKSELVYFAKLSLEQIEIAKKIVATPKRVRLQNIGSSVNTTKPEYSPVISLDGSALYFTSRREWENKQSNAGIDPRSNLHPEDIYVSYKDIDGAWMEPVRMEFCDSLQYEATVALSSDERRVYVYQDTKGNGDIFYSDFSTSKFQEVNHLREGKINSSSWETHCTVTPDGQQMYFVSDRPEGFGSRDIYRVVKLPDGTWSEPQNLGPKINGPLDEESPFIAVDNKTLYFSSNGNKSMGGFDVFVSVRDENNNWSDPINLGYPLNSAGDDLFYTTTVDGYIGYLTSSRKDGFGEKDIYEIQNDYMGMKNLAVLKGQIHTYDGKPLPEDIYVTLRCLNCGDPLERKILPRMRDGVFLSSLDPCREYEMIFSYENGKKEFYREKFNTECDKEYTEVYRDVWLNVQDSTMGHPYIVKGNVLDEKTKQNLKDVKVKVLDKSTNGNYVDLLASNGSFQSDTIQAYTIGDQLKLTLELEKEGYVKVSYDVTVDLGNNPVIDINKLLNLAMVKMEVGLDIGALNINPIYFDFDKFTIRPDAAVELDKIVKIMMENPTITIELGSHTDTRGSNDYNLWLSDQRAKSSAAYIVSKGIAQDRITGKGYGETKLKVSDVQIANLKAKEAKEAAHQKNRRTEFIIVKE